MLHGWKDANKILAISFKAKIKAVAARCVRPFVGLGRCAWRSGKQWSIGYSYAQIWIFKGNASSFPLEVLAIDPEKVLALDRTNC